MNVKLTPELEQFIEDKISTGSYQSPSEVIVAGLKLLKKNEAPKPSFMVSSIEELHQKLDESIASLDRGEYSTKTADEVIAEAKANQGMADYKKSLYVDADLQSLCLHRLG